MYGIPSALMYDVAVAMQGERIERANLLRQAADAAGDARNSFGIVHSIRRGFGRSLIALGQAVQGGRIDSPDHATVPASGTLRLAR